MKENSLSEGMHWTGFSSVVEVPLQAQVYVANVPYGGVEVAVSRDRQSLGYTFNVSWQIRDLRAARNLSYYNGKNWEDWGSLLVSPPVGQAVKNIFVGYTLEEILGSREVIRSQVAEEISRIVEERLVSISPQLSGAIQINQVNLTNLDWNPELKSAIESTQIVAQGRLQAQQTLELQTLQMQTAVRQAEADRDAMLVRVNAEAEAARVQANAQRDAMLALREAGLDPNLISYLEKWDGVLPRIVGSGDQNLMMQIPEL
jgi:regulator of protease activity HflC (stomatin/prohibitin superfamily)